MDLYYQYDENLADNEFFKKLQSEHKIIIDTAPLEHWIICIPRVATLQQDNLADPNFLLAHILIPNDELPKSHFTNLLGQDIHMENKKLLNSKGLETIVLFEEVFYTKTLMKYKVWCIECPLYGQKTKTSGIFIVRDVRDAIELIWNETQSKTIFQKIDNSCTTFINQHKKNEGLEKLRTSIQLLFDHCLHLLMFNKRLKEKCRQDSHFYKILKIALETYLMSNLYHFVFDAISVNTLDDSQQFNRNVRNLSQVHLSYFGIDQKYSDLVTSVRTEMLKIENYTTAIEKLACLRRSLNATSRHSANSSVDLDHMISILVFVLIKSGLTHWFATFKFLKEFILNDLTELSNKGADSFLVTTLEAAVFYIKTFNEMKRPPPDGPPLTLVEQRNTFVSKADFIEYFFNHIRGGHEEEILRLLHSENNIEITKGISSTTLCHPLCDCENCSIIIEEKPNVNGQNYNGITALHIASMSGLPKMINLLLALDADLTLTDENNWTALHYAAARGHQNVLLLLLHAGVDINAQTNDKYTSLHLSCLNGHQGCVKALLYYSDHMKVKIDKNLPNKTGDTPLHSASTWGFVEIIETLLEYGVKIDRVNRLGYTASDYANNSYVSEQLQNTFVIIDDDPSNLWTNVNSSPNKLFRGYIDEKTIKSSIAQHKKTDNDKIIAAIRNGDIKLAYYFLGLNFPENNIELCHPLCACNICSQKDQSKDFNENDFHCKDVDVNGCNSEGVTLLHAAALVADMNLIQYLLSQGASVNKKTLKNETVLHFAVRSRSPEAIELILSKVSEETFNSTDDEGNTAFQLAVRSGNSHIVDCTFKSKYMTHLDATLSSDATSSF